MSTGSATIALPPLHHGQQLLVKVCVDAVALKAMESGRDGQLAKNVPLLNAYHLEEVLLVLEKAVELSSNAPPNKATSAPGTIFHRASDSEYAHNFAGCSYHRE